MSIQAVRKTGFVIPVELAGKLGELQASADIAADRLNKDCNPRLAAVLREWASILRNLHSSTYFEPAPVTEQIEEVA